MTEKLYYWAEALADYTSDNEIEINCGKVIEIRRLNFFIGKNNAGKSRFLREIFISQLNLSDYNFLSPKIVLERLLEAVKQSSERSLGYQNSYGGDYKQQLLKLINEVLVPDQTASKYELVSKFRDKTARIFDFYDESNKNKFNNITESYRLDLKSFYQKINFNCKFYIPILRGMRPVTEEENKQPYIERAQKDYFF